MRAVDKIADWGKLDFTDKQSLKNVQYHVPKGIQPSTRKEAG